jgi:hypothetical protein
MGARSARDGIAIPWSARVPPTSIGYVRIMLLWRACRGLSREEDARWVEEQAERLCDCDAIDAVDLHPVESAGRAHPAEYRWCLELWLPDGDARTVMRDPACAGFLADLRLLGTRPSVFALDAEPPA